MSGLVNMSKSGQNISPGLSIALFYGYTFLTFLRNSFMHVINENNNLRFSSGKLPLYKVENLVSLRQTKHIQYKIRKIRILILSDVKLEQHKIFAFTKP